MKLAPDTGIRIDAPVLTAETWAAFCAKYGIHPNVYFPGLRMEEQTAALRAAGVLAPRESYGGTEGESGERTRQ